MYNIYSLMYFVGLLSCSIGGSYFPDQNFADGLMIWGLGLVCYAVIAIIPKN